MCQGLNDVDVGCGVVTKPVALPGGGSLDGELAPLAATVVGVNQTVDRRIVTILAIDAFLRGAETHPIAVAKVPTDIQAMLQKNYAEVFLSRWTANKQKKHPEITADSFSWLQNLLDSGERMRSRDKHVIVIQHREAPYVVVLKATNDGNAIFLQSFRRTDAKDIKKLRKQGAGSG